jgi:outer membrane protein
VNDRVFFPPRPGWCQPSGRAALLALLLAGCGTATAAAPSTLTQALAEAYADNPTLQQQRGNLRISDENVSAALAGWRPTVTISGTAGPIIGSEILGTTGLGSAALASGVSGRGSGPVRENRTEAIGQLTVTQPVFQGGRTIAGTREAKNNVYAARAQLLATEQNVFLNVVQAYVAVITDRQLLALDLNNIAVLQQQQRSVNEELRVGTVTQTSVAQAQASVAQAEDQAAVARGNLRDAEANFRQYVGSFPAPVLVPPQPLSLPVRSKVMAVRAAMLDNPSVVAALFTEAADKDAVDVAFAALAPQLSVQASAYDESNPLGPGSRSTGGELLANLSVPLYQGGAEYATIRQARDRTQVDYASVMSARRAAITQAIQAWESLIASRTAVASTRQVIRSDAIALEGTEREQLVGTRDVLDVLNAQQALLNAQTQQIQNIANVVTNSYTIAAAAGRLTTADLGLPVHRYDDLKYYRAVKNAWIGTGDAAYRAAGIDRRGNLRGSPRPASQAAGR